MNSQVELPMAEWAETDQLPAPAASPYPLNDSERAVRFANHFGSDVRYVASWKSWLRWDGTRWARDEDGGVMRLAQEMPKLLLKEAAGIESFDERKKAANAAIRAGDAARLHAMIQLAGAQSGIAALPQIFDADPYLFSVGNGVVDLRTGCFRQAKKEDYLTKHAGAEYIREARCPQWIAHLHKVFAGDESLASFFQCAVGYSLTGVTFEQVLFFLYGTGRNGKSTTTETLQTLLGDYAQHAPAALFVADKNGREPEKEIARLLGSRLVIGSEIEEGARLAESRVKDLTGQDTLTGRFLYSSPFDFKPTHKLWIFGNHKPDVSGNDFGIWRRMRLIPFSVQIEESQIDQQLPVKLIGELSGILNWAIDGCLMWQKSGLHAPRAVELATDEYKDEEDELGEFVEEKCEIGGEVDRKELHEAYLGWAFWRGIKVPLKPKAFAKRLRSRIGISERKSGDGRFWIGISRKKGETIRADFSLTARAA
jgi:putative DNA primase/helicase